MKMIERESWGYTYSLRVIEKIKKTPGLVPVKDSCHFTVSGARFEVIDEEDGQVYEIRVNPLYKKIYTN